MRLQFTLAALVTGAAITAGCGVLLDLSHLDDGAGGAGTSSGAGGTDAVTSTSAAESSASATSGGSTGGGVSSTSSGGGGDAGSPTQVDIVSSTLHFKIDATEVTTAKYAAFVKAFEAEPPASQKQHEVCSWNKSVRPNTAPANDAGIVPADECTSFNLDTEAVTNPNLPIRCIDWCDAAAYCLWAGGHMCRSNEGDASHPIEWKTACASTAGLKFPYGPSFEAGRCVDATDNKLLPVGSKPLCESGYKGVLDISGNIAEWLDCGCEYDNVDSTKTQAYLGGGAYHNTGDELDCVPVHTSSIVGFRKDVGARCCYDAP